MTYSGKRRLLVNDMKIVQPIAPTKADHDDHHAAASASCGATRLHRTAIPSSSPQPPYSYLNWPLCFIEL